jgi:rhodanese-related sulfurtransferase
MAGVNLAHQHQNGSMTIAPTSSITRRFTLLALGLSVVNVGCSQELADTDSVTLEVARNALTTGKATFIDIREPQEHATGVAAGAQLLPMRQLESRIGEIPNDPKQPVLLICNTQNRSSATLRFLRTKGYTNVRYVQGGMSEWNQRGWPLVKPL